MALSETSISNNYLFEVFEQVDIMYHESIIECNEEWNHVMGLIPPLRYT